MAAEARAGDPGISGDGFTLILRREERRERQADRSNIVDMPITKVGA